jgi:hypothetical protein
LKVWHVVTVAAELSPYVVMVHDVHAAKTIRAISSAHREGNTIAILFKLCRGPSERKTAV